MKRFYLSLSAELGGAPYFATAVGATPSITARGDRNDIRPFGQFDRRGVEKERAEPDHHHPPAENFGVDAGFPGAHLRQSDKTGAEDRQIAKRVDRLRPQACIRSLALNIEGCEQPAIRPLRQASPERHAFAPR
ncbi:MAG: hypothetical protein M3Y78_02205 [Pseudomonadota bacterium]|nr:hypothetical protein [Pseudomonadota bacterium]